MHYTGMCAFCNVQKDKLYTVQECVIFKTLLKVSNNLQGIRRYIVNLREFLCASSNSLLASR